MIYNESWVFISCLPFVKIQCYYNCYICIWEASNLFHYLFTIILIFHYYSIAAEIGYTPLPNNVASLIQASNLDCVHIVDDRDTKPFPLILLYVTYQIVYNHVTFCSPNKGYRELGNIVQSNV